MSISVLEGALEAGEALVRCELLSAGASVVTFSSCRGMAGIWIFSPLEDAIAEKEALEVGEESEERVEEELSS